MTFERFCQSQGIAWHIAQPLHTREWLRILMKAGAGDEYLAGQLEQVSDKFNSIGLADPTRSDLVQDEFAKHWKLQPPSGYSAENIALWRKLPFRLARWVSEKRRQDILAIRKCQNLESEIRKRRESEHAA